MEKKEEQEIVILEDVLVKIFDYLHLSDLLCASLVCKHWFKVASIQQFQSKILVNILRDQDNEIELNDETEPAVQFIRSNRNYYNLKLVDFSSRFIDCSKFFNRLGETLQTLYLGRGVYSNVPYQLKEAATPKYKIECDVLFKILQTIKNPLKELHLDICIDFHSHKYSAQNFAQDFCSSNKMVLSRLEKLHVQFYFCDGYSKCATNMILLELLLSNNSTLRNLELYDDSVVEIEKFSEIWETLQLQTLSIHRFSFTLERLQKLLSIQPSLKVLILRCFIKILPRGELRNLKLNFFEYLSSLSLENLKIDSNSWELVHQVDKDIWSKLLLELKNLTVYNFTKAGYYCMSPRYIARKFGAKINKNIVALNLGSKLYNDEQLQRLIQCFPNLVHLDISFRTVDYRLSYVTDSGIQCIIKNLKHLVVLNLASQNKITDYGLTGINVKTGEKMGHSINELCRLSTLNFSACVELTDFTLINAIKFQELKTLCLTTCDGIGAKWSGYRSKAIESVINNCPSLEIFLYYTNQWNYLSLIANITRLKKCLKLCFCGKTSRTRIVTVKNREELLKPICHQCFKRYGNRIWSLPVFRNLPKKIQFEIFNEMTKHNYRNNQLLVRQGKNCIKFCFILEGSVRVTKCLPNSTKIILISKHEQGYYFGDRALLQGEFLQTTNIICETSEVCSLEIYWNRFESIIRKYSIRL